MLTGVRSDFTRPPDRPLWPRTFVLSALALAVLIVATYGNTFGVPFLLDDIATLQENPSLSSLATALRPPAHVFSAGRPVLNVSFALDHAVTGEAVWGYHVTNLLIHVGAALTLFATLRRALLLPGLAPRFGVVAPTLAFAIAGLWAMHPLQTGSITYISQRAESLMGLFLLLTLYGFLRGATEQSTSWLAASVAACALGMGTKEGMVVAPLLVFLLDATAVAGSWRAAGRRWRYYVTLSLPWLLLAGLMATSRLSARAVGFEHGIGWLDYARLECRAVVLYVQLAAWPAKLIFDYGPGLRPPSGLEMALSLVLVAIALGGAVWALRRRPGAGLLACAFFLMLAPTSSVVPVAGQPIAENRVYIASVALIALVAVGAQRLLGRRSLPVFMAAIAALALSSHARNATYRSAVTIWRDTVAKQPGNSRAWLFYSDALWRAGTHLEAIEALSIALRHAPKSAALERNLAIALFTVGRRAEALTHFESAAQLSPESSDARFALGMALLQMNKPGAALDHFLAVSRMAPDSPDAYGYAGLCSLRAGRVAEAIGYFRRALDISPTHQIAREGLEEAMRATKE
jgi:protein O-mannosyl-transferase